MPTKRRKGRNNRPSTSQPKNATSRALVPTTPANQRTFPVSRNRTRRNNRMRGVRLSEAGTAFLKCAFAAPDFAVDPGKGVPDSFTGRTCVIKDSGTLAINFTAGKDTYIIIPPIPGLMYAACEVDNGKEPTKFQATFYPTNANNFGGSNTNNIHGNQFTSFRYASQCAGLYPTSNYTQFSGSLSVWKAQIVPGYIDRSFIQDVESKSKQHAAQFRLNGMGSISVAAPRESFSGSFINGAYTVATNIGGSFDWSPFHAAGQYSNFGAPTGSVGDRSIVTDGVDGFLNGFGNLETIIIKVTSPAGATNSALLKTWNCVEVTPETNSPLFQFSHLSPNPDPMAMMVYNKIRTQLPVAVVCSENSSAWDRVSKMILAILNAGSFIPGPVGMGAGGLATTLEALRLLTV